jgi:zinc/manganese transport system substrate-binding protein
MQEANMVVDIFRLKTLVAGLAVLALSAGVLAAEPIKVVASFSIMADLVKQVGGERVAVRSLAGPNADMHAFEPTPADIKDVTTADLVVINGLGLEGWADRLVKTAGFRGQRLVASKGIKVLPGHSEHGRYDPHAWQEVANVKVYVANIAQALSEVDAVNRGSYEQAAADYTKRLDTLDAEIRAAFAGLPKERRRVITSHDAFSYYGDAYDIEFLAPQGVSEDAQPSAKRVSELITQIKREKVKAIFVENISNERVVARIAKETGATVGGTLYSDALSKPTGPAATYIDMMRHNTRLIAAALRKED